MGTLTNLTRRDVRLPTMHVVPREGSLEIADATVRSPDNWPTLCALTGGGTLAWAPDPEPEGQEPDEAPAPPPEPSEPNAVLDQGEPAELPREARMRAALDHLPEDAFTASGLPKVEALTALLFEGEEPVTAAERDALWATHTVTQAQEG